MMKTRQNARAIALMGALINFFGLAYSIIFLIQHTNAEEPQSFEVSDYFITSLEKQSAKVLASLNQKPLLDSNATDALRCTYFEGRRKAFTATFFQGSDSLRVELYQKTGSAVVRFEKNAKELESVFYETIEDEKFWKSLNRDEVEFCKGIRGGHFILFEKNGRSGYSKITLSLLDFSFDTSPPTIRSWKRYDLFLRAILKYFDAETSDPQPQ